MNSILAIGQWFAQNWPLLTLLVLAIILIVPTVIKQKKENAKRTELNNSIKKGMKVVTYSGIYGTVESIENTTDGQIVTITTGTSKNPSTMTMHINAIMGVDNKVPEEDLTKVSAVETETLSESSTDTKPEKKSAKKTK